VYVGAAEERPADALKRLACFGIAAVTAFAAIVTPFLLTRPDAWHQYLAHVGLQFPVRYSYAVPTVWNYGRELVLVTLAGALTGLFAAESRPARRIAVWGGVGAFLIVWATVCPAKGYYLVYTAPWLCAATVSEVARRRVERRGLPFIPVTGWLCAVVVAWGIFAERTLVQILLPSGQRFEENEALLRRSIPAGSTVLGYEFWSSLAGDHRYFSMQHSTVSVKSVDYVVLTGNGSGVAGMPKVPANVKPQLSEFRLVHDGLNREPFHLFGLRLSRSAPGYGFQLLRRVTAPVRPTKS